MIETLISILLLLLFFLGFQGLEQTIMSQARNNLYLFVAQQEMNNLSEHVGIDRAYLSHEMNSIINHISTVLPLGHITVLEQGSTYQVTMMWGEHPQRSCNQNNGGRNGCLKMLIPQKTS